MDTLVLSTLLANGAALAVIVFSLAVTYCWPTRKQSRR
jgi:hypothetical protein